ncbi:MAG: repeat domain protein [Myxococcales bacterium]|nr:repeat domain protein [Myxococcales bacterium]
MQLRRRFSVAVLLLVASCGSPPIGGPSSTAVAEAPVTVTKTAPPASPGGYRDIVDTDTGGCVLYTDGRVACWKHGRVSRPASATFVPDLSDAIAIESVPGAVRVLRRTGKVYKHGLAFGTSNDWVSAPGPVVELAERCLRLSDGTVHCDCHVGLQATPFKLEATDVASGGNARCAVTKAGDVECWGQPSPVLGNNWSAGTTEHEGWCPTARASHRFGDATAIVLGDSHGCVQRRSGAVACWGEDDRVGGKRAPDAPDAPVTVKLPPAQWLRAAQDATCAITRDRDAYCWGDFRHPAFAKGVRSWQREPVKLPLDRVTAISQHVSSAIVDDGNRVVSWSWRDDCAGTQCDVPYDIAMPR